tara:strand:- start:301 stop:561 length:261 start_codon:yes stop_codon:yes gene_type:complete
MDINIVITKLNSMLVDAQSYVKYDAEKTAITGATVGVLTVNSNALNVEGAEFTDLLNVKLASLDVTLSTIKTRLQSTVTALDTEID